MCCEIWIGVIATLMGVCAVFITVPPLFNGKLKKRVADAEKTIEKQSAIIEMIAKTIVYNDPLNRNRSNPLESEFTPKKEIENYVKEIESNTKN